MLDGTPHVGNLSLPRTSAGFAALQACRSPGSAPSAERLSGSLCRTQTAQWRRSSRCVASPHTMQPYLHQIKGYELCISMAQIRCSSHKLRGETGRYTSEARHERTCRLCNPATAIEDEQHILLLCTQLDAGPQNSFSECMNSACVIRGIHEVSLGLQTFGLIALCHMHKISLYCM